MKIVLHVPFRGLPQKRHRLSRGRVYDPSCHDKKCFLLWCQKMHTPVPQLYSKPLHCKLTFTFLRPKSHCTASGALRKAAPKQHVCKPDTDNLAKFVLDALNGVYYKDDSQICLLSVHKKYGDIDSVLVELQVCKD